jgi:hypothetical protein
MLKNRAGKLLVAALLSSIIIASLAHRTAQAKLNTPPIRLHPANPHYFLFRGKPTVLITSGEHYGAVLNADVEYKKYLATIDADGLNYTRIFGGSYVEVPAKSFGILRNDLAPQPNKFIAPWFAAKFPVTPAAGTSSISPNGIPNISSTITSSLRKLPSAASSWRSVFSLRTTTK